GGGKVTCLGMGDIWCPGRAEIHMSQTARFQEILRRLAIMDEGVVQDQAGLGLGQAGPWVMDPKTAALVQMGALVAIGSPAVCLEWGVSRALAAGGAEGGTTDVRLARGTAGGDGGEGGPPGGRASGGRRAVHAGVAGTK